MEGSADIRRIFFVWWYTEAYSKLLVFLGRFFVYLIDLFSVKSCLLTLFYPWRRDLVSYEGLNISDRFQVLTLNLSSRFIGAIIKIFTLLTFIVIGVISLVLSSFMIFSWLIYPLIILICLLYGLLRTFG